MSPISACYALNLSEDRINSCNCHNTLNDYMTEVTEYLIELAADPAELSAAAERITARQKLIKARIATLMKSGSTAQSTGIARTRQIEIQNCLDKLDVHDFATGADAEKFISTLRTARTDHVATLPKAHQAEGDEILARTAKKFLANDVKLTFQRLGLETKTTEQLISAIEDNFSSKLSIFQELRKPHDVTFDPSKGLSTYFNELQEASRHSFRQVERMARRKAAEAAKTANVKEEPEVSIVAEESYKPADGEAIKASELNDLYAATLGYLTVCRVYPNVGIRLCDSIDECANAQEVFVKAKTLLDRLPSSVTSEESVALAGKTSEKSSKPSDELAAMQKSIRTLTDKVNAISNAVVPAKDSNKSNGKGGQGHWKNKKGKNNGNNNKSSNNQSESKAGCASTKDDDQVFRLES